MLAKDFTIMLHTFADGLPICMRVLLEAAVRHCDGIHVTVDDVMTIINWQEQQHEGVEVSFKPARVTLHDFTYVFHFSCKFY